MAEPELRVGDVVTVDGGEHAIMNLGAGTVVPAAARVRGDGMANVMLHATGSVLSVRLELLTLRYRHDEGARHA